MVIVLIATRYQTILNWIQNIAYQEISSIGIMKQNGPKIYLYVDSQLSFQTIIRLFKQTIQKQGGAAYVYEFYGIYNGMIDYNAYMSETGKQTMKYYQSIKKDITDLEILNYQQAHSLWLCVKSGG